MPATDFDRLLLTIQALTWNVPEVPEGDQALFRNLHRRLVHEALNTADLSTEYEFEIWQDMCVGIEAMNGQLMELKRPILPTIAFADFSAMQRAGIRPAPSFAEPGDHPTSS